MKKRSEIELYRMEGKKFGERLLKNELNVLLTRGVKGLYIYAVDPALQEELMRRQGEKNNGK